MIESCATGTPVIIFNAPSGISEITLNGIKDYMVDKEQLYIDYLNKN